MINTLHCKNTNCNSSNIMALWKFAKRAMALVVKTSKMTLVYFEKHKIC